MPLGATQGLMEMLREGVGQMGQHFSNTWKDLKEREKTLPPPQALRVDPEGLGIIPDLPPTALAAAPFVLTDELATKLLKTDLPSYIKGLITRRNQHLPPERKIGAGLADIIEGEFTTAAYDAVTDALVGGKLPDTVTDVRSFMAYMIKPKLKGKIAQLEKENPYLLGEADEFLSEVTEEGGKKAAGKVELQAGKLGLTLQQMQQADDPFAMLAGKSALADATPEASKHLLRDSKHGLESTLARKVVGRGESLNQAAQQQGVTQPWRDPRVKKFQEKVKDLNLDATPATLLKRLNIPEEDVVKVVNEVIGEAKPGTNWSPRMKASGEDSPLYQYLVQGLTPQEIVRKAYPFKHLTTPTKERELRNELFAISQRVMEKFGVKQPTVEMINQVLKQVD